MKISPLGSAHQGPTVLDALVPGVLGHPDGLFFSTSLKTAVGALSLPPCLVGTRLYFGSREPASLELLRDRVHEAGRRSDSGRIDLQARPQVGHPGLCRHRVQAGPQAGHPVSGTDSAS